MIMKLQNHTIKFDLSSDELRILDSKSEGLTISKKFNRRDVGSISIDNFNFADTFYSQIVIMDSAMNATIYQFSASSPELQVVVNDLFDWSEYRGL